MTTQCPICRSPVEVDDAKITPDGFKATCPLCEEVFVVRPASAAPLSAPAGGTRSGTPSHGSTGSASSAVHASRRLLEEDSGDGAAPRVLVAHDSHAFGATVKTLLEEEGFDVEVVHDGDAAMSVITDRTPAVAILEAALPRRFGFQICADVRGRSEPLPVKLLLVASVYDRRRLGRSPTIAVAPDDFLEPRNLELELLPKVKRLLRGRTEGTGSRSAAPASRDGSSPEARARNAELSRSEIAPRPPEVLPPQTPARRDPTHPTHPTMGEADFADLFEDGASATGSRSLMIDAPAAPPIDDVDAFLAAPGSAPTAAPSADGGATAAVPDAPPEPIPSVAARGKPRPNGDDQSVDSDEREIWERVLAEEDDDGEKKSDDELLRSLMEMANGSEDDSGARGVAVTLDMFDEKSRVSRPPVATANEKKKESDPLDEILDQVSGPKVADGKRNDDVVRVDDFLSDQLPSEDYSADETPAIGKRDRAPSAGPLDIPSVGPVPDAWKPGKDEEGALDDAMPEALVSEDIDDDPPMNDVITAEDLLGGSLASDDGIFEKSAPRSESSRPTAPMDDDEAPNRRGPGVLPSGPKEGPTVLKKGGTPVRGSRGDGDTGSDELSGSAPPPVTMEDSDAVPPPSFNSTELSDGAPDDDIDGLLNQSLSGPSPDSVDEEPARTRAASHSGGSGPHRNGGGDASEHEKAKRLAKLIVGDILLYNADKIAEAVRSGTFFDVMKGDIKDGREFFDEKVPESIRSERDYIQELLDETLANKKRELGLS